MLHKWRNEVKTDITGKIHCIKHTNIAKCLNILADLEYLFLGSPIFVFLKYVLEVAAPHISAHSAPDQQVLRHPPHLGRGKAAQGTHP